MTVIDILTRLDSIRKKKKKDLNFSGDVAFVRLYAAVKSDIESSLQKAEAASTEKNRAEIHRTKARLAVKKMGRIGETMTTLRASSSGSNVQQYSKRRGSNAGELQQHNNTITEHSTLWVPRKADYRKIINKKENRARGRENRYNRHREIKARRRFGRVVL